jgi:hypothetical protein
MEDIKKCKMCSKRLGRYTIDGKDKWEMEVVIDNLLVKNFKSYSCCGLCALSGLKK